LGSFGISTKNWSTPVSSTNKTDRRDKVKILLKVALSIITLTLDLKSVVNVEKKIKPDDNYQRGNPGQSSLCFGFLWNFNQELDLPSLYRLLALICLICKIPHQTRKLVPDDLPQIQIGLLHTVTYTAKLTVKWFSLGTPVSSTNKTDRRDKVKALLIF
jgi:hypothetical protein